MAIKSDPFLKPDVVNPVIEVILKEKSKELCHSLNPFLKERIDETIFPVVAEYESVGHKPFDSPLRRCGVKDGCRREESHREDLAPAFGGEGRQHAQLECRETTDEDFIVVSFARKDNFKPLADIFL